MWPDSVLLASDQVILGERTRNLKSGRLVVATAASHQSEGHRYAECGRNGRLLGTVAQNLQEDEDAAIILCGQDFPMSGSGSVHIADGGSTHANTANTDSALSIHDVRPQVLCQGEWSGLSGRLG